MRTYTRTVLKYLSFVVLLTSQNFSAQNDAAKGTVTIDKSGVMRWENGKEVKGFGVNYSVPFAHAYRQAKQMGVNPKEAIDNDSYHFARLGFDLYRLHVWDTEISDSLGNLLENEHLETFDYLLKKLKDHNINFVITPIAFWGNGWPEPDEKTPGFSHKYGKDNSLTHPKAIEAAQNYLYQFLNHVNPYTGVAYKDEPNIIAFEVSNEPHHRGEGQAVTAYVRKMVSAMRKTGTEKPIFYNMSHGVHFAQNYFDGGAQGGTFQWYPTGLGYQRELPGNLLPNVDNYHITFEEVIKENAGAKLVYEFDAADVGRSYIYPVMARSFREAGIQIATHFAYDPTYLAPFNTEYNTHYMNLAFTPQKALSLMIAGKVFQESDRYTDYGTYPNNMTFGNVSSSYEKDLALYNAPSEFIYTNSTETPPVNEKELKHIAGYGNSPVVNYDGTGAYFLDQIDKGIWRLEVMPDAIWVRDPFGRNSPNKTVGAINWKTRSMQLHLKDLGSDFILESIDEGNSFVAQKEGNSFTIRPGTYIVSHSKAKKKWSPTGDFETHQLNDFYAPATTVEKPYLLHRPIAEASSGEPLKINVQFVAPFEPKGLELAYQIGNDYGTLPLQLTKGYTYTAILPSEKLKAGFLNYFITVQQSESQFITYPAGDSGNPYDWDFFNRASYQTRVVPKENPIYLFNAKQDHDKLVRQWRKGFELRPTENFNEAEYVMPIGKLFVPDSENLNAKPIYDYTFKHFILDAIEGRKHDLDDKSKLVFKGRSLQKEPLNLQIAFVLDDGSAYGNTLEIQPEMGEYEFDLNTLKPVNTVTLPRPYPTFLPYYLEHDIQREFNIQDVESLQISIGTNATDNSGEYGLGIVQIKLK